MSNSSSLSSKNQAQTELSVVVSPALSFASPDSVGQSPPLMASKKINNNNNISTTTSSTRSSLNGKDDDNEFRNFVLLPENPSQESELDEVASTKSINENEKAESKCFSPQTTTTTTTTTKQYFDVHRHPNTNQQSILPPKRLNKFHFLGLGISIGATALIASRIFNNNNNTPTSSTKSSPFSIAKQIFKLSSLFTGVSLAVWSSLLLVRWNFFMFPKQVANEPLKNENKKNQQSSSSLDPRLLLSATQIAQDLRDGKYTSVEICTLFIEHIEKYNDLHVNAICFRRYATALKEAGECDKILDEWRRRNAENGKNNNNENNNIDLPFFLGCPCTVKESFQLVGAKCTSGHPGRIGNLIQDIADQAPAVTRYQNAGAVIICTTTCSELCMWLESYSDDELFGTTCNPYDSGRIVGGSTGGEAAAISSLASPFGLGGDFGGSLRIPAWACGLFTIKPSTRSTNGQRQFPAPKTWGNFMSCTGPLARNVEDLFPLLKILQEGGNGLDEADGGFFKNNNNNNKKDQFPDCPLLPSSPAGKYLLPPHKDNFASLKIYVCEELPIPLSSPVDPLQRKATRLVCETFAKKTGATLHFVDFAKPETVPPGFEHFSKAIEMWSACSSLQPVSYVKLLQNKKQIPLDEHGKERHDEELEKSPNGYSYSVFGEMAKWFLLLSNHTFPSIALGIIETLHHAFISDNENEKYISLARNLTKQIGEEVLGDNAVIVLPTFPHPAPEHHSLKLMTTDFGYCALFNALQLPSAQVPVWLNNNNNNTNENDEDEKEKQVLPLGVQIVSKWGNDVLSLQVANGLAKETPFVFHKVPEWM
jgi:fatty acid amide hydrolase 2